MQIIKCVLPVYSISFSKDGEQLASVGRDRNIRLWSTQTTGSETCGGTHTGELQFGSYLQGGQFIASASLNNTVRLWNRITGEIMHVLKDYEPAKRIYSSSSVIRRMVASPATLHTVHSSKHPRSLLLLCSTLSSSMTLEILSSCQSSRQNYRHTGRANDGTCRTSLTQPQAPIPKIQSFSLHPCHSCAHPESPSNRSRSLSRVSTTNKE